MPLQVAWRLLFRVNNRAAADRCTAGAQRVVPGLVVGDPPKPYWKSPELWEVSCRSEFTWLDSEGIVAILKAANALGNGWYVMGPSFTDDRLHGFDGVFDVRSGRAHATGLHWASFSLLVLPRQACGPLEVEGQDPETH
jgi:hypothetical protein